MPGGHIFVSVSADGNWPPPVKSVIVSGSNNFISNLIVDTDGTIGLLVRHPKKLFIYTSPILALEANSDIHIAMRWESGQSTRLYVNQQAIELAKRDQFGRAVILTPSKAKIREATLPRVDFRHVREPYENRFIGSFFDLQDTAFSEKPSQHELLECSAILRRLFLDENPLVNQVKQNRNINLRYIIRLPIANERLGEADFEFGDHPPFVMSAAYTRLAPMGFDDEEVQSLTLKAFLSYKAIGFNGKTSSIKNIISYCANHKGGVHFDEPKKDYEKDIEDLDQSWFMDDIDMSLWTIKDIAQVAAISLHPLVKLLLQVPTQYQNRPRV